MSTGSRACSGKRRYIVCILDTGRHEGSGRRLEQGSGSGSMGTREASTGMRSMGRGSSGELGSQAKILVLRDRWEQGRNQILKQVIGLG